MVSLKDNISVFSDDASQGPLHMITQQQHGLFDQSQDVTERSLSKVTANNLLDEKTTDQNDAS